MIFRQHFQNLHINVVGSTVPAYLPTKDLFRLHTFHVCGVSFLCCTVLPSLLVGTLFCPLCLAF